MTETPAQHPWAKYYTERGVMRPGVADVVITPAASRGRRLKAGAQTKSTATVSTELAAAVRAATAAVPNASGTPFVTAVQKEAMARAAKRVTQIRLAKRALATVAALLVLHVAVTQVFNRAPAPEALQAHVQTLPETVLALYSSARQPLQADGVVITQADEIQGGLLRYVATVTLRLRQPLYVPAVTNGTVHYRRLQESLQTARDQEMRFNLFPAAQGPELPALPTLLQRSHQTGEAIIVRVPFTARRFGWQWRLVPPQVALRVAHRELSGDSLARYADTPYLIFGDPRSLVEIRQRMKMASDYVVAVAKEVQKHSEMVATSDEVVVEPSLADRPAVPTETFAEMIANRPAAAPSDDLANMVAAVEPLPAFDPNAPAVLLPGVTKVLQSAKPVRTR